MGIVYVADAGLIGNLDGSICRMQRVIVTASSWSRVLVTFGVRKFYLNNGEQTSNSDDEIQN
jgi:hypothetical protein